jgi:transglutaminase-like putative cysteine protease
MEAPSAKAAGALLLAALIGIAATHSASARPVGPILHEPIAADPREDLALHVALDGDLPAALETSSGVVPAPDVDRSPRSSEPTYGPGTEHATFMPDRETSRPEVGAYDEPFTPATAPFKRLEAFDAVRSDYRLYVRDEHLVEVPRIDSPDANDDAFYADLVVDVASDRTVRIPSVGPGARIVRAYLALGADDVPVHVMRDGADNWFLRFYRTQAAGRARLVMEVAIARAALGGDLGDPRWSDLPLVPALPPNVAREAALVRSAMGVNRRMRPREAIEKLVSYFRGFTDSDESPSGHASVYLDLALSKKGVCRHRAFAFLVTAQSLGIPARMITNEVHAWVEVHDGTLWHRIDLGGAGLTHRTDGALGASDRAAYAPLPDPFAWPPSARPGSELAGPTSPNRMPGAGTNGAGGAGGTLGTDTGAGDARGARSGSPSASRVETSGALTSPSASDALPSVPDDRPASSLSIEVAGGENEGAKRAEDPHRGQPLFVRGEVRADGEPCGHLVVEVWLRAAGSHKAIPLGSLATSSDGSYAGSLAIPADAPLGDYEVVAKTAGDSRCGGGAVE